MSNDDSGVAPPPLLLSKAEARRRFYLYLALKLTGLGALFGGVVLSREGSTPASVVLLLFGAAVMFVRPKLLGLTTRPEKK